jgi:predicted chitinase
MLEKASGAGYENNKMIGNLQPGDGPRFKGRGFKQLTGHYNYAEYWCFKGWLKKGKDFDVGWEHDPTKRYPKIDNPERLIETSFNCIDAGFWYIAVFRHDAVVAMDQDDVIKVTKVINGGDNGRVDRTAFTNRIKRILL